MPTIAKSLTAALLPLAVCAQAIRSDPLTNATMGPPLEIVHLFDGQWPTGTPLFSSPLLRLLSSTPLGLPPLISATLPRTAHSRSTLDVVRRQ